MFERILEQNCQTFDNFNFEFSMSHHNAHYQSYKNAPYEYVADLLEGIDNYFQILLKDEIIFGRKQIIATPD